MDSCIPESGYLGLAYASSESSIDRVKHHYFLLPRDCLDMDMLDRAVMRSGNTE
jgi:hypothetical protein